MKLPHFGSLSLTSRLTVFYTISTIAILLFAVVFQFFALVSDLEFEDNDFLADKIKVLQSMIAKYPDNPIVLKEEIHWENAMRDYTRYMVRVADKKGKVLLETAGMGNLLTSDLFPPPAKVGTAVGRGKKRASRDGRIYLVNSAWATAGGDEHFRQLQVAFDISDDEALLDGYRKKMVFIFLAGIALSAGLSIFIARRGLRPLGDITEKAEKITAELLYERISERVWPRERPRAACSAWDKWHAAPTSSPTMSGQPRSAGSQPWPSTLFSVGTAQPLRLPSLHILKIVSGLTTTLNRFMPT